MNTNKALRCFLPFILIVILINGCYQVPKQEKVVDVKPSFKKVWGVKYTEVKRSLQSGLTFAKSGYQLEADWRLSFPSDDSATIYSPERKVFYNFPVTYDHDSIVNMARTWLRVKKVTRDSLVFQILKVEGTTIFLDIDKVYMTFYANDYITNKLHSDTATIKRPSKADTAYIRKLSNYVNTHPDTAFAARQPVVLVSKSPNVTVKKKEVHAQAIKYDNVDPEDTYMYPEYTIEIRKAYATFISKFSVYADSKGNLIFDKALQHLEPGYEEQTIRIMKGLVDGYLKAYVAVKPGTTLGIPHTSRIYLHVKLFKY